MVREAAARPRTPQERACDAIDAASSLSDRAIDILASATPSTVASGGASSSHHLKLFWDGRRMAESIPALTEDIRRAALENSAELSRMEAELAEQQDLAASLRHNIKPLFSTGGGAGGAHRAGGRQRRRGTHSAGPVRPGTAGGTDGDGQPVGQLRHPILAFGDEVVAQIMRSRGSMDGMLTLERLRSLLDRVIAEVRVINEARAGTDVRQLMNVRSSFILLSKAM